jgi:hypothetical protein
MELFPKYLPGPTGYRAERSSWGIGGLALGRPTFGANVQPGTGQVNRVNTASDLLRQMQLW